ncbi:MAG: NUDIX hydrolase, partial [Oceanobacter sp.]
EFSAGDESLEVELFSEDEIPWDNLAFPTVEETLRRYFDNPTGEGKTLTLDIGSNRRITLD